MLAYHHAEHERADRQQDCALFVDGSLPNNEVVARLWPWDQRAVAIGSDPKKGLVIAIEMQMARKSLAGELLNSGIDHPLFNEFLVQQLSIGPGLATLNKEQTRTRFDALQPKEKQALLTELVARLRDP